MGSAGAAQNGSPQAFRMFSSKECWSNCPQRLPMPSAFLAVLVVTSRGRVVVIPCEVHVGTSAWWYQNNRWSHSAELGMLARIPRMRESAISAEKRACCELGHQRGTNTIAGVIPK
jgi:hypothetical protein